MNTQEKLWRAKRQGQRWHHIGGIVVDVADLLQHLACINGAKLSEFDAEQLAQLRRSAALVASHALRPVISAPNDEQYSWIFEELNFTA